ncbi:MAG: N-acetylmuramoyl-L-alanine amidase [Chlamydia sp.]
MLFEKNRFFVYVCSFSALFFLTSCTSSRSQIQSEARTVIAEVDEKNAPIKGRRASNIKERLILLDPGHGGTDIGCRSNGVYPQIQEKNITLALIRILQDNLKKMGYRVALTRSKDIYLHRQKRAEYANTIRASLFISLHCNWTSKENIQGIEIFYYKNSKNRSRVTQSKRFAEIVLRHLLKKNSIVDRGVKHGNFWVVRETNMPAILVEVGFLSNKVEALLLNSKAYKQYIAQAIATGTDQFIKESGI